MQFVVFGTIAVAVCYCAYVLTATGGHIFAAEALAIPGGVALAGAMQAITGVRFSQLSAKWNSLAGWQRGVVGVFVCVFCFALAMLFMVVFGRLNGLA